MLRVSGMTGRLPVELPVLVLPFFFVVLYGNGFVGAKLGLPDSSPLSFLSLRFWIAGTVLLLIARVLGNCWPGWRAAAHIAVAGSLTVCTFSVGAFISIDMGVSPALSALIISLQPILVALLAQWLVNERPGMIQWIGLLCGFAGVALVVGHAIDTEVSGRTAVAMSVLGLVGLALGAVYQKRFCADMELFAGGAIQSLTSALICTVLLFAFETYRVEWSGEFISALLFMSIGVSVGALSLLYIMIRRGEVSRVSSVFYLVPVSAAVGAYLLFGQTIESTTLLGAAVIALGIYLSTRKT